jgi:hypothetical protein
MGITLPVIVLVIVSLVIVTAATVPTVRRDRFAMNPTPGRQNKESRLPLIDRNAPATTRTATFAMG